MNIEKKFNEIVFKNIEDFLKGVKDEKVTPDKDFDYIKNLGLFDAKYLNRLNDEGKTQLTTIFNKCIYKKDFREFIRYAEMKVPGVSHRDAKDAHIVLDSILQGEEVDPKDIGEISYKEIMDNFSKGMAVKLTQLRNKLSRNGDQLLQDINGKNGEGLTGVEFLSLLSSMYYMKDFYEAKRPSYERLCELKKFFDKNEPKEVLESVGIAYEPVKEFFDNTEDFYEDDVWVAKTFFNDFNEREPYMYYPIEEIARLEEAQRQMTSMFSRDIVKDFIDLPTSKEYKKVNEINSRAGRRNLATLIASNNQESGKESFDRLEKFASRIKTATTNFYEKLNSENLLDKSLSLETVQEKVVDQLAESGAFACSTIEDFEATAGYVLSKYSKQQEYKDFFVDEETYDATNLILPLGDNKDFQTTIYVRSEDKTYALYGFDVPNKDLNAFIQSYQDEKVVDSDGNEYFQHSANFLELQNILKNKFGRSFENLRLDQVVIGNSVLANEIYKEKKAEQTAQKKAEDEKENLAPEGTKNDEQEDAHTENDEAPDFSGTSIITANYIYEEVYNEALKQYTQMRFATPELLRERRKASESTPEEQPIIEEEKNAPTLEETKQLESYKTKLSAIEKLAGTIDNVERRDAYIRFVQERYEIINIYLAGNDKTFEETFAGFSEMLELAYRNIVKGKLPYEKEEEKQEEPKTPEEENIETLREQAKEDLSRMKDALNSINYINHVVAEAELDFEGRKKAIDNANTEEEINKILKATRLKSNSLHERYRISSSEEQEELETVDEKKNELEELRAKYVKESEQLFKEIKDRIAIYSGKYAKRNEEWNDFANQANYKIKLKQEGLKSSKTIEELNKRMAVVRENASIINADIDSVIKEINRKIYDIVEPEMFPRVSSLNEDQGADNKEENPEDQKLIAQDEQKLLPLLDSKTTPEFKPEETPVENSDNQENIESSNIKLEVLKANIEKRYNIFAKNFESQVAIFERKLYDAGRSGEEDSFKGIHNLRSQYWNICENFESKLKKATTEDEINKFFESAENELTKCEDSLLELNKKFDSKLEEERKSLKKEIKVTEDDYLTSEFLSEKQNDIKSKFDALKDEIKSFVEKNSGTNEYSQISADIEELEKSVYLAYEEFEKSIEDGGDQRDYEIAYNDAQKAIEGFNKELGKCNTKLQTIIAGKNKQQNNQSKTQDKSKKRTRKTNASKEKDDNSNEQEMNEDKINNGLEQMRRDLENAMAGTEESNEPNAPVETKEDKHESTPEVQGEEAKQQRRNSKSKMTIEKLRKELNKVLLQYEKAMDNYVDAESKFGAIYTKAYRMANEKEIRLAENYSEMNDCIQIYKDIIKALNRFTKSLESTNENLQEQDQSKTKNNSNKTLQNKEKSEEEDTLNK